MIVSTGEHDWKKQRDNATCFGIIVQTNPHNDVIMRSCFTIKCDPCDPIVLCSGT